MRIRAHPDLLAGGLLILGLIVALWPLLCHPLELPYSHSSDLIRHYLPFKQALHDAFQRTGHLPLWDPHTQGGHPIMEDPGYGAWYPLGIPFWLFPPHTVFSPYLIGHALLAVLLAHAFCKELGASPIASAAGALAYAFNLKLSVTRYAGFITMIASQAWLPGAFLGLLLVKKSKSPRSFIGAILLLSLSLAMQVLAGDAQLFLYTGLGLTFFALFIPPRADERSDRTRSRAILGLATAGILAVLFAWPAISGGRALAHQSVRAHGVPYAVSTLMSVPPSHLPSFFFPALSGSDADFTWRGPSSFWEVMFYPGGILWFFSLAGLIHYRSDRRILPFLLMAWLTLLFSFGRHTPLYTLAYFVIPYVDHFRGPARILPILALILSALGAIEITRLKTASARWKKGLAVVMFAGAAGGIALLLFLETHAAALIPLLQANLRAMIVPPNGGELAFAHLKANALALTMAFAFVGVLLRRHRGADDSFSMKWFEPLLFVIMAGDLLFAGRGLLRTAPLDRIIPPHALAQALRDEAEPGAPSRVLDLSGALPDAVVTHHGLYALQGMNPLVLLHPYLFSRHIEGEAPVVPRDRSIYGILIPEVTHPALLDLLRVRDIIRATRRAIPGYHLQAVYHNVPAFQQFRGMARYPELYRYRRTNDPPYAWWVGQAEVGDPDPESYLRRLEAIDIYHRALIQAQDQARLPADVPVSMPTEASDGQGATGDVGGTSPIIRARVHAYSPEHIRLDLPPQPRAGLLLLSEVYSRGWIASVDGHRTPLIRAHFLLRGVVVPKGGQRIEVRYNGAPD